MAVSTFRAAAIVSGFPYVCAESWFSPGSRRTVECGSTPAGPGRSRRTSGRSRCRTSGSEPDDHTTWPMAADRALPPLVRAVGIRVVSRRLDRAHGLRPSGESCTRRLSSRAITVVPASSTSETNSHIQGGAKLMGGATPRDCFTPRDPAAGPRDIRPIRYPGRSGRPPLATRPPASG